MKLINTKEKSMEHAIKRAIAIRQFVNHKFTKCMFEQLMASIAS